MSESPAVRSGYLLSSYVREIADVHYGLRCLRLRLSELRPDNREDDVLRAMDSALRPMIQAGKVRVFHLPDSDYLLSFHRDHMDEVRALLIRLRFLVPDDPLNEYFAGPAEEDNPLLQWWRLEDDFSRLRALAEDLEAEVSAGGRPSGGSGAVRAAAREAAAEDERIRAERLGLGTEGEAGASGSDDADTALDPERAMAALLPPLASGPGAAAPLRATGPDARWTRQERPGQSQGRRLKPIDLEILDRLQNGIAGADLSNHVRRQPVCALVGSAPPQPVFSEVFVSIPALQETIAPSIDITANRWLFLHFTEILDHRVLSWLMQEGGRLARTGIAININIPTILSEHFLRFEQVLSAGIHGTVILEVRVEDVFADLEAFAFARDFVHQRGYRLCLDFLSPDRIAMLDRDRMGIDLLKLFWTPGLPRQLETPTGQRVAERLRRGEHGRTILARCDDPAAIALGRSLDITLFQGHHVDRLVSDAEAPPAQDRRR
ncbi:hypothetical protein [Roseospira navarrensis]|uniref:EAL domain-containing protein n=1 Tax=Roseospira navarrensis TaxID=140058 RepID=A0A7X2D344_9PROT|nr:hypothetical protein [Roseospira navarrensis]MQX35197.1 hypothetical protein [Roseospira navarrensis]